MPPGLVKGTFEGSLSVIQTKMLRFLCRWKIFLLVVRTPLHSLLSLPQSLFPRSDLNQFTNSIMLSLNTGWEMMNDYVKHIISPLHHHCNMTAKFHSSYPISSLFKERKLLVPVIRYVAGCVQELSPLPLGFLPCFCTHTLLRMHTHRRWGLRGAHVPHA